MERCEQLGLERVVAIIAPNNAASKKILSNNVLFPEKLCEIDGLPGEILAKEL
ncbi:putative acetyltransferase [Metabacillus niabensis]|uniref:Acetyltransferase n=1 Tax=Metabacillus niabensis TaxID=324854 RepID=A0ABT9YWX5_9BACI|nr:putative acetyltransferase [Metabacillus niabensis]